MTRLASAKSMLSDLAISRIAHVDIPRVSRKKLNASAAGTEVAAESDTGFVGAAQAKLKELAEHSPYEFFAMHALTGEIVARVNASE